MATKQTYCECNVRTKYGKVREPWTLAKIFGARTKAGNICKKCGYVKWTFPSPLDVKKWYDSMKPKKKINNKNEYICFKQYICKSVPHDHFVTVGETVILTGRIKGDPLIKLDKKIHKSDYKHLDAVHIMMLDKAFTEHFKQKT